MSETIQIRISKKFDERVLERLKLAADGGRLSHAARRELERYTYLNEFSLREVREIGFTENELGFIADTRNGIEADYHISPRSQLIRDVTFAIEEGVARKWDVNIIDFQQKMSQLTEGQAAALIDAIERWWASPSDDPDRHATREGFANVGLMAREADSSP